MEKHYTPKDVDRMVAQLKQEPNGPAATMMATLLIKLRLAEARMRNIETTANREPIADPRTVGGKQVKEIKWCLPEDEDSWFFTKEEALQPVRIRHDYD